MAEEKTFMVEDARIIFRNFSGEKSKFNAEGDRNFAVVLDEPTAQQMLADGWNVKFLEPRDDGDEGTFYVSVKVSYANRPPRITVIAGDSRTLLPEADVDSVDSMDIRKIDLFCRGYEWDVNGKQGVKAYLQSMFITINEDPLERKYREMATSKGSDD